MIVFLIVSAIVLLAAIVSIVGAVYMFNLGCVRKTGIASVWDDDALYSVYAPSYEKCGEEIVKKRDALRNTGRDGSTARLEITSHDGLRLTARLISHGGEYTSPRGIIAMFHGFRSEPTHDFGTFAMDLRNLGFMLLMVDQRAHGGSEGRYITYGVHERLDAVKWCELLSERYPDLPVILYGLSMGASTVMMASELSLPSNVRGVVADCGYTTPAEICRKVLTNDLHVPAFPVFHLASLLTKFIARFSFNGVSAVEALKNSNLPILMFHGTGDKFVPHEMSVQNHAACADRCTFVSVEGAGHGESYLYDKEGYIGAFCNFAEKLGF